MTADSTMAQLLADYPNLNWLMGDPELKWLLVGAMDPDTGYDANTFAAKLQNTNWYRTHTDTERQWLQFTIQDPASAEKAVQNKMATLGQTATDAGLKLSDAQLRWEATAANNLGWTDAQARQNLLQVAVNQDPSHWQETHAGSIGTAVGQVKALAAQYLIPLSEQQAASYGEGIWLGNQTLDSLHGTFGAQATNAWGASNPALAQAITAGITPRQFIDPQIQGVAKTLEMSADQIDPMDPKWTPILNYNDGKTTRMMTVPEAQQWARGQAAFRFTDNGRASAAQEANNLTQLMGKTA